MKYMLMFFDTTIAGDLTPEERAAWYAFRNDVASTATLVASQALEPAKTAGVVSIRNGQQITTDGPFIETKEQLGGFYVIDCDGPEAAFQIAAKCPSARTGHVEIRAVHAV